MSIRIKDIDTSPSPTVKRGDKRQDLQTLLNRDIRLFGSVMNFKRKEDFYGQMAVLLSSGLDIRRSLELLEDSQKKKNIRKVYLDIRENLVQGSSLSEAMEHTEVFSDYELFSIRIGEETGKLEEVLISLQDYYKKAVGYQRQLIQALSYPSFVILFSVGVVVFMLQFLVPMFSEVYDRFEGELPWITQKIIALSDWMGNYGLYLLLFSSGLFIILYLLRKKETVRKFGSYFLLYFPIFGPIAKRIYLTRFCASMAMLLRSKVPLINATALVRKMVGFYPIETSLEKAEKEIMGGESLNKALKKHSFYPNQLTALIRVGEESGKLDGMFETLARQYSDETEQRTAVIGSLLEPILIIFLGIIVGFILVAMYLPMFEMSTNVGF